MIANITEQLWIDFDLDIAVFLDTLAYWIKKNAANQRHFYDGRYWSYNSYPAFTKMFPGWKIETIRRIIRNCVKHELILIGNYNKKTYDNTNWYTLTDKALQYYPSMVALMLNTPDQSGSPVEDLNTPVDSNRPPVDSNRPIPKNLTTRKDINNSEFDNSPAVAPKKPKPQKQSSGEALAFLMALINVYREVFPDNPQPHKRVIATSLQRTLSTLVKRWPELDPDGLPLTVEVFKQYLTELKANCPKFALGEYVTDQGTRKKNSLETFARWNTVVKFLENAYS